METPRYASCEFAMVKYRWFTIGILMMYVIVSEGDISTSGNLAAILDLWYTSMSYDIGSTTIKKRDHENVGAAVGIFSLCALELEICLGGYFYPLSPRCP